MQGDDESEALYSTNKVTANCSVEFNTFFFLLTSVVRYVWMIQLLYRRIEIINGR